VTQIEAVKMVVGLMELKQRMEQGHMR